MGSLIDAVCEGRRLAVVLRPNNAVIGSEMEDYDESYALPFVYVEKGVLAGLTRTSHMLRKRDNVVETIGFSYSPDIPVYSLIYPTLQSRGTIVTKINASVQYDSMQFRDLEAGPLRYRYESGAGEDLGLAGSIAEGRSHYGVMGFGGDRVIGFPIDIAYDFYRSGRREFRAECFVTSTHVLSPAKFRDSMYQTNPNAAEMMAMPRFTVSREMPATATYLRVFGDGTFHTVESEPSRAPHAYDWLRVYAYP